MKSQLPDYYGILEIPETASQADIREAYKKQALLHHPDRLSDNTPEEERQEATRRFQIIADAYYILGDTHRRETYDQTRRKQQKATPMSDATPGSTPNDANRMFGNVFEELLRPEVEHVKPIWQCLGAGAGALLGFIFANVPGAAVVSLNHFIRCM
ncbi:DnaJ domain-containing protein [Syncephalastrum racemosum]|uniref:DnaJ domain-containing protein n=1 Tax=Syncephalastrum racemosum TaxID=13706 RepID=A0A1X2H9J7_SYNRA|nr:DnaJ domain-containing protein [Syncephalastrum racemosum]